jgi:hypothetical protein
MQNFNKMSSEQKMRILFEIYYQQCNGRKIEYTAESENQCWIVMDGIELTYMMYQGIEQPIFMCARLEDVYYFKTFNECEKIWYMDDNEVINYKKYITI